jgi:hypothetical protein
MMTNTLIMLLGGVVPVMAASVYYVGDRRSAHGRYRRNLRR